MTDDLTTAGPLGEAGARLRALVAAEAHMIVRTLRPTDEGSWAVNELFIQKVLERFADALLSGPPVEAVTCSLRYPDYVCHRKHWMCPIEEPHHIDTCGQFLPKRAEKATAPVVTQEGEEPCP